MTQPVAFQPAIQRWFDSRFGTPTDVQARSWPLIAAGRHVLATAPTGSGKTLTAFLWALDQFASGAWETGHTRVLYVSPLKALNTDIRENLLTPLKEIRDHGAFPELRVQTRSGDTSPGDRQRMLRRPPEILITTPESLALLLTSRSGMNALTRVATVILDEVHAVVDNRRGVQLMTSLERLADLSGEFQRVALSATVEPLSAVAEYVAGFDGSGARRPMDTVRATNTKQIDFRVRFPEEVRQALDAGKKIWDPLADSFRDLIEANTSTLFFTNSRRLAEKITLKVNEDLPGPLAYAHHGSLAREIRTAVEQRLKAGELKAIVATSSLEMGIDIGYLDEVVLVQSPPSVAATLQRVGRAGHHVGEISRGTLFPTHAQDFLEAAVLSEALARRDIERLTPLTGCLDILAQIVIATTAQEEWRVADLHALLRRSAPYHDLSLDQLILVIEMLAGRYAGSRVRELKPRISYDRIHETVRATRSALLAYYANGGSIPDRGYYKVRHAESGSVIGELDEEFVWEASVGQTFAFGTQNWRVQRITHNDVLVQPAPPGTQAPPFWRAETLNRSFHFSERIGAYLETAEAALADKDTNGLVDDLVSGRGFERTAALELLDYLQRQRDATGTALPHRHHLLIESVRSGPGGYKGPDNVSQAVLHTFWGGRLNRPFALALAGALADGSPQAPEVFADNNCIVIQQREPLDPASLIALVRPDNVRELLRRSLEQSGFFGARFRECAGRALLLTRNRFNQRLPLWMSRLQAKKLMASVKRYSNFPILLETWRTCLADEFELDELERLLSELADGVITWSYVSTTTPSPFAANVTFDQISRYMYADDTPEGHESSALADRLIADAIAHESLRPRLSGTTVTEFEAKRQRRHPDYRPAEAADWLDWVKERILIPESEYDGPPEGLVSVADGPRRWLAHPELLHGLLEAGLISREALQGVTIVPIEDPRDACRFATEILSFYGPLTRERIRELLPRVPSDLFDDGSAWVHGRLLADSEAQFSCEATNYEILLRFQRAALRPDVVARPAAELPAVLARWQGFGARPSDDALAEALLALRGYAAGVRTWLNDLVPARFGPLPTGKLDETLARTELHWFGCGRETIALGYPEDRTLLLEPGPAPTIASAFLDPTAAYSFEQLADRQPEPLDAFADAFWTAVWAGALSADGFTPLQQGLALGFKLVPVEASVGLRRRAGRGRLRPGGRTFPGSWRLLQDPAAPHIDDPLAALEDDKERARLLLDRYGFVCREIANREGGRLRWAPLFRALRMMELSGEIVAGYFFESLSGPQFMTPAAVQAFARPATPLTFWVSASDPVAPTGLGLSDPRLPQRRPQHYLSYLDDELALVVENLGRRLTFHVPPDHPRLTEALAALEHLVARERRLTVETINDVDARQSPYLEPLGQILQGVKDHKQIYLESR